MAWNTDMLSSNIAKCVFKEHFINWKSLSITSASAWKILQSARYQTSITTHGCRSYFLFNFEPVSVYMQKGITAFIHWTFFKTLWHHMVTKIGDNIGSCNGLLPDGTKPLSEPMLLYPQWFEDNFTKDNSCINHLDKLDNYVSRNSFKSHGDQGIKTANYTRRPLMIRGTLINQEPL